MHPPRRTADSSETRLDESKRISNATAIVLAGGTSVRMGENKIFLKTRERIPLLTHIITQLSTRFDSIIIGSNDPSLPGLTDLPVIQDLRVGEGPLMGLYSCLKASSHQLNFVTACDIPEMNLDFIEELLEKAERADAVVPLDPRGRPEPLFATYSKAAIPKIKAKLDAGQRRIRSFFEDIRVHHLPMPSGWYRNLNTPADYKDFLDNQASRRRSCTS